MSGIAVVNSQARLDDAAVLQIRRLYGTGGHSQQDLAAVFGVTQTTIGHIVRRVTWKHVTDEEDAA